MASDAPRKHLHRGRTRAPSALVAGSAAASYTPSPDPSPDWPGVRNYFRSISAMKEFQHLSAEELRLIDYTHSGSARAPYALARDPDGFSFQTLVAMPEYAFASPEEIRLADYWAREGGSHVRPVATPFAPGAARVQPLGRDPFYAVDVSTSVTETRAFTSARGAAAKPAPKPKPQSKRSSALRDRFKQVDQLGRSPSMPITGPSRPRPVATGLSSSISVQGIRQPRHADRGVAFGSGQPLSPVMQRSSRRMNLEPVSPFSTARAPTEPPPVAVVQVEPVAPVEYPFLRIPPRNSGPRALFQPSPLAKLNSSPGSAPAGVVEPSSDTTSPSLPSATSPTLRAALPEGRSRLYRQLQAMCRKAEEFDDALDDLEEDQKLKSLCRKADEFNQALDRLTVNHALPKFQDKEESEPSMSSTFLPAPHNTPTITTGETTLSQVARQVEAEEYDLGEEDHVTSSVPHEEQSELSRGTASPSASANTKVRDSIEGNTRAHSNDLQFVQAASLSLGSSLSRPTASIQENDRVNPAHTISSLKATEINIQGPASRGSPITPAPEIESFGDHRSISILSKSQVSIKGSGTSPMPLLEPGPVSSNPPVENVSNGPSIATLPRTEINIESHGVSAGRPSTLLPIPSPVAPSPEIESANDARSITTSATLEANAESTDSEQGAAASQDTTSVSIAHRIDEIPAAISHLENLKKQANEEAKQSIPNSRDSASPSSCRYFLGLGLHGNSVEHYGNGSPAVAYSGRQISRARISAKNEKSPRSSTTTFSKRTSISSKASPPGGALSTRSVQKELAGKPLHRHSSPVQLKTNKGSRPRSMTTSVTDDNTVKRHHAEPVINLAAFPLAASGKPDSSASEILRSVDSEKAEASFSMGSSPARASSRRSPGKALRESPLSQVATNVRESFAPQAEDSQKKMVSSNPFEAYVDKVVPKEITLKASVNQEGHESKAGDESVFLLKSDDPVVNVLQNGKRNLKAEMGILSRPLFPSIPENEPLADLIDGEAEDDDEGELSTNAVVPPADTNIDLSSDTNSVGEEDLILTELYGLEDPTANRDGAHRHSDRATSPSPSPVVTSSTARVAPSPRVPVISMTQLDAIVSLTAAFEEDSVASGDEMCSARENEAPKNNGSASSVPETKVDDELGEEEVLEAPNGAADQIVECLPEPKPRGSQDAFEIVALQQLGFPAAIPAVSVSSRPTSPQVEAAACKSLEGDSDLATESSSNSLDQDVGDLEYMSQEPGEAGQTSAGQRASSKGDSGVVPLGRSTEKPIEILENQNGDLDGRTLQTSQTNGFDGLLHSDSSDFIIEESVKGLQIVSEDAKSPEEGFCLDSESSTESQESDDLSEERDPLSQNANFSGSERASEDDHRYLVEEISIHDFIPSGESLADTHSGHDDDSFFIVLSRDASENDSCVNAVSGQGFTLQNTYAAAIVVPAVEDHDDGDAHVDREGFSLDNAYTSEIVVPVQEDPHDFEGSPEYDSASVIIAEDKDTESGLVEEEEQFSSSRFVPAEVEKASLSSETVSECEDDGLERQEPNPLARPQLSEDQGENDGDVGSASENDDDNNSVEMNADVGNRDHDNNENQPNNEDDEQVIAEDAAHVSTTDALRIVEHNVNHAQRNSDTSESSGNDEEKILIAVETDGSIGDRPSAASEPGSLPSRVDIDQDNCNVSEASVGATAVASSGAQDQHGHANEFVARDTPQLVSSPYVACLSPRSEYTWDYGSSSRRGTQVAESIAKRVAMFSARSELGSLYLEYHGMESAESNSTPQKLSSVTQAVEAQSPKVASAFDLNLSGEDLDETKTVSTREVTRITFADTEESVAKRHRSPPTVLAPNSETSAASAVVTDRTPPNQRLKPGLLISPGRPAQSPRFASVMYADPTPPSRRKVTVHSGVASSIYPKNYVPESLNELISRRSAGAGDVTCVPTTPQRAPRPAIIDADITPERDLRESHGLENWLDPSADQATEDVSPSASMTMLHFPVTGRESSLTRRHSVPPRTSQELDAVGAAGALPTANSIEFSEDGSGRYSVADEIRMRQPSSARAVRPEAPTRGVRNHTMFTALAGITGHITRKNSDGFAPRASTDVGTGRKSMSAAISPTTAAVQHMIARESSLLSQHAPQEDVDRNGRANFMEGVKKLFSRVGRRRERPEGEPTRITRRLSLARGERRERESLSSRASVARRTKSEYRSPPKGRGRR